ncbi:MAG: hypothetical protein HOM11_10170 [Methylococcales bacterium]|jgi:chromosome segregation ATPase|nr:hypothetical protein [Methylococcales bacterium]MBT7445083.1 hypothetical protein [Methylococcales bacterium]
MKPIISAVLCLVPYLLLTGCGPSEQERALTKQKQQLQQILAATKGTLHSTQQAKASATEQVIQLKQSLSELNKKLILSRDTRNTALGQQHLLEKKYQTLQNQLSDAQNNHSETSNYLASKQKIVQAVHQEKARLAQTLEQRSLELSQQQSINNKVMATLEETTAALTLL